jgi:hypothetical protein
LIFAQFATNNQPISELQQCTFVALEAISFHGTGPDDMCRKGVATNCTSEVDRATEAYYVIRIEIRVWPLDTPDTVKAAALHHGAILHPAI